MEMEKKYPSHAFFAKSLFLDSINILKINRINYLTPRCCLGTILAYGEGGFLSAPYGPQGALFNVRGYLWSRAEQFYAD